MKCEINDFFQNFPFTTKAFHFPYSKNLKEELKFFVLASTNFILL
jgi:hypothetical protein